MMHKAWSNIKEVLYCFSRSSVKWQGHIEQKNLGILTQICGFWNVTPVWFHQWLRNETQSLKYWKKGALLFFNVIHQISRSCRSKNHWFWPKLGYSRLQLQLQFTNSYKMMQKAWSSIEEVPYCFSRSFVKFQGHRGKKIPDFDPNSAFLDCNFSLNSLMAMKWCTKLEATYKRCSMIFLGHLSYFKVTQDKISQILTHIRAFQTVTPVWIHQWLWNDAQNSK